MKGDSTDAAVLYPAIIHKTPIPIAVCMYIIFTFMAFKTLLPDPDLYIYA